MDANSSGVRSRFDRKMSAGDLRAKSFSSFKRPCGMDCDGVRFRSIIGHGYWSTRIWCIMAHLIYVHAGVTLWICFERHSDGRFVGWLVGGGGNSGR